MRFLHRRTRTSVYSSLSLKSEQIRLVRLYSIAASGSKPKSLKNIPNSWDQRHPSTFWDTPFFEIKTYDLKTAPPYVALSYTWGDKSAQIYPIRLNGKHHDVRENLYVFLCYWANRFAESKDTYLWIDQLCIDQTNLNERNRQVGLMSSIYHSCEHVIAWLGHTPDLLKAVERFGAYPSDDSLEIILNCTYWSRVWIIQELLLAPEIRVYCGHMRTSLHELWEKSRVGKYTGISLLTHASALLLEDSLYNTEQRSLQICIERYSAGLCEDSRDKVYGLLGLVPPEQRPTVDYTKSTEQVFIDTVDIVYKYGTDDSPEGSGYGYCRSTLQHACWKLARNMGLADSEVTARIRAKVQEMGHDKTLIYQD